MEAADMANYGELSMLEQARGPQGDTRGAGMLGYVLGGGARAHAQQIGMQGAITGARMQEILAEARRVQQAEINRQSLQHRYYSEGKNALAEMIGTMKEVNPNLIADYNQKEQKTGYSQQAWQTAHGEHPDLNTLNRELMVIDGKPQQLTKIEDNTVLNPMTTPDTQNLQTTELGRAIIGAKGAEANSANTAATLHNAEAESARALTENRKAELPTIGANKVRKFSEPEMSAALGGPPDDKGKQHIDPQRLAAFLAMQSKMPQANDADVFNAMKQEEMAANTQAANTPSQDMASMLKDAPAAPTADGGFTEGGVYADAHGNKARYVKGQWVPVQ
jgi:hypothetical protein